MGSKKDRFCICTNGVNKLLFSLEERQNGDLIIFLRHAQNAKLKEKNTNIKHQKYSLHVSSKSQEINVIKHTLELEDGKTHITRNFTKAIKLENLWTPLFYKRYPDLAAGKYDVPTKNTKNTIVLGSSSNKDTLIQGLFVTNPKSKAAFKEYEDISITEYETKNFKLSFFSSLLEFPANFEGMVSHFGTHEKIQDDFRWTHEGSDLREIEFFFEERREWLRNQFLQEIISELEARVKLPHSSFHEIIEKINPKFKRLNSIENINLQSYKSTS